MNISIISSCNNNCEYCFQKDYHAKNEMLTYEEIDEIIKWAVPENYIGILGGEPTLHPDIVRIVQRVREFLDKCIVFTNLLCKHETLEELIKISNVDYLINTTTRDELKDLFLSNIDFLYSQKDKLKENHNNISFGLTLMNNEEIDNKNIENIFNLMNEYQGLSTHIRMGLATPFEKGTFKLINYGKPVEYMINRVMKDYTDVTIGFDCPSNNCQIPPKLMGECLENKRVTDFTLVCCSPVLEVLTDKSLIYCFSCPDDFMKIDDYRRFPNATAARKWYETFLHKYMQNNACQCRRDKPECINNVCSGCCPAINEHLRRQSSSVCSREDI